MDALMSHILTSAKMKSDVQDTPLDLAWSSFTKHTCDRLIAQEHLRTELVSSEDEEESHEGPELQWTRSHSSSSECASEPVLHVSEHSRKKEPHPFSIAALIDDTVRDNCRGSSAPAQIFSSYTNTSVQYQNYFLSLSRHSSEIRDNSVFGPMQAVSILRDIYWCHVCSAICKDRNEADRHQFAHGIQGDRSNLRREIVKEHGHVTSHEMMDNEMIKCGLCQKVVPACFFHKHQRVHNGHFCEVCGKEFATNSRLQDHMNVHTGRTPYSCAICDRKFAKRSSLTQHQRYHRDHKSFMCRFCHKYFNSKYACAVHERLHTGENPFKCQFPDCTRAFPQKIQLKLHINSDHRA